MKINKILITSVIFFELSVVLILAVKIYRKINIFGSVSVNPINNKFVSKNEESTLQYFYEFLPNTTIKDKLPPLRIETKDTINSDGLNETINYSVSKPKNTFRIITIGDSYTYGLYINAKDNWTKKLEILLNKNANCRNIKRFEVMNLGVPGYDIEYSIERFRLKGEKYNPDLVLFFLKNDDFEYINEYILPKEKQIRRQMNLYPDDPNYYYKDGIKYPTWDRAGSILRDEIGEKQILEYQLKSLKKMNNYYNRKLFVFTFHSTNTKYKNIIGEFSHSRKDIFFYDNLVDIYKLNYFLYPDPHPSQEGHKAIAEDLFKQLVKDNIIPCK